MNLSEKLQQVAQLKAWLDSFRPLSPTLVRNRKNLHVRVHQEIWAERSGGRKPRPSLDGFFSPSDF